MVVVDNYTYDSQSMEWTTHFCWNLC